MPVPRIPDHLLPHLTPAEAERYRLLLERELALASPLDLACWLRPETKRWPHIEYINQHLVALVDHRLYADGPGPEALWYYERAGDRVAVSGPDEIPDDAEDFYGLHPDDDTKRVVYRLAIAAPPRHGKSYLITESFPLWYWSRFPDRNLALATYSDEFAADWGVKLRTLICDHEDKLGLQIVNGRRSASDHLRLEGEAANENGEVVKAYGEMFLVGSRGALTGRGFQAGVIDDPFKNSEDAESAAERNSRSNWYTSTFMTRKTRLEGKGIPVEVMVFTRWHVDDIAGRHVYDAEDRPNPDWCVIRLPALAEDDDPLGRAPGDALCPAVKTKRELLDLQGADPYWFASLYQGSPSMRKGGLIPSFRRYVTGTEDGHTFYQIMPVDQQDLPTFPGSEALQERLSQSYIVPAPECVRFATVDLAASKATYADWSVFSVWDWHPDSETLVLVGMVRERVESAQHKVWVVKCYNMFPDIVFVGIEKKTYGLTLLQELVRSRVIPVRPLDADTDKIARAVPYGQAVGQGQIVIPLNGVWVNHWASEHAAFPSGKNDDMVDTGGYAWKVTRSMPSGSGQKRHAAVPTAQERIHQYVEKRQRGGRKAHEYHRLLT